MEINVALFALITGLVIALVQVVKDAGDGTMGFVPSKWCGLLAVALGLALGLLSMLPPASLAMPAAILTGLAAGAAAAGTYSAQKAARIG